METNINVGTGAPAKDLRYQSKYKSVYADLAPGKYVESGDRQSLQRLAAALTQHIKRNGLPWRIARRANENRIYVLAADGDKPTDRKE